MSIRTKASTRQKRGKTLHAPSTKPKQRQLNIKRGNYHSTLGDKFYQRTSLYDSIYDFDENHRSPSFQNHQYDRRNNYDIMDDISYSLTDHDNDNDDNNNNSDSSYHSAYDYGIPHIIKNNNNNNNHRTDSNTRTNSNSFTIRLPPSELFFRYSSVLPDKDMYSSSNKDIYNHKYLLPSERRSMKMNKNNSNHHHHLKNSSNGNSIILSTHNHNKRSQLLYYNQSISNLNNNHNNNNNNNISNNKPILRSRQNNDNNNDNDNVSDHSHYQIVDRHSDHNLKSKQRQQQQQQQQPSTSSPTQSPSPSPSSSSSSLSSSSSPSPFSSPSRILSQQISLKKMLPILHDHITYFTNNISQYKLRSPLLSTTTTMGPSSSSVPSSNMLPSSPSPSSIEPQYIIEKSLKFYLLSLQNINCSTNTYKTIISSLISFLETLNTYIPSKLTPIPPQIPDSLCCIINNIPSLLQFSLLYLHTPSIHAKNNLNPLHSALMMRLSLHHPSSSSQEWSRTLSANDVEQQLQTDLLHGFSSLAYAFIPSHSSLCDFNILSANYQNILNNISQAEITLYDHIYRQTGSNKIASKNRFLYTQYTSPLLTKTLYESDLLLISKHYNLMSSSLPSIKLGTYINDKNSDVTPINNGLHSQLLSLSLVADLTRPTIDLCTQQVSKVRPMPSLIPSSWSPPPSHLSLPPPPPPEQQQHNDKSSSLPPAPIEITGDEYISLLSHIQHGLQLNTLYMTQLSKSHRIKLENDWLHLLSSLSEPYKHQQLESAVNIFSNRLHTYISENKKSNETIKM